MERIDPELKRMSQTLQKFRPLGAQSVWSGLAVLGVLVLLMLAGVGCGRSTSDITTLQLSTWGSAQEITVLKSLLSEFERTHPRIHVDLLHIPENYYQKLHILVAGDMAPDVIFTNSISFPIYAAHGVFRDLRPFLRKQSGLSEADFYTPALKAFTWQGEQDQAILGALPRDISNVVIFYNKDLFKAAGVPEPKAGWTWEEFRQTALAVTQDRNNDGDADVFGFSFYSQPPLFWLPFVWSAGGDLFSADLKHVMLDQAPALQGLQFYADLRNKWHVAPQKVESGGATMSQLFMQQKLAMMVNGRWSVPVLREQAKFNWDVVPLPVGPSGQSRVGIDASGYAIAATSPHPNESFELIRFLLSKEAISKVTESGLIVPARPDVAQSDVFLGVHQDPAHSRAFLDVIPEGVPTRTPPRWNEFSEELNLALEPTWDGKQSAAEAARASKPELEKILETGL